MNCPFCNSVLRPKATIQEGGFWHLPEIMQVELECTDPEEKCTYEVWTYLRPELVEGNWALIPVYQTETSYLTACRNK